MATGTFTYNALRTKTLKRAYKNTKKNCKSFILDKSNAVSVGTTTIKPYLYICPAWLVQFARDCGKMYSRHLFSYGGLVPSKKNHLVFYNCKKQFPKNKKNCRFAKINSRKKFCSTGQLEICCNFLPLLPQFFEYGEEAEWVVEVMKNTGKPTAITMCIGPVGDSNNVSTGECAVKLARAGK